MKILFICGSLEPGRDGVGDYVRRLAGSLLHHGHEVKALAINDRHIDEEINELQQSEGFKLPTLRMPQMLNSKTSFLRIGSWVNEFNPDWLSLQFVPFSFHSKGLPIGLGRQLKEIGRRRKWHIMFHELWVGMDENSSFKNYLWGRIQRRIIKSTIRLLDPLVIHTQATLYQFELLRLGVDAGLLPLFSNIPVAKNVCFPLDKEDNSSEIRKVLQFVVFGQIHSGSNIKRFAKEAGEYANENNNQLILRFVGRCGKEQEEWKSFWNSDGLISEVLGEQSAEKISRTLQMSSIGISTTPPALLEKSGSLAAMLEHGLPVIVVSEDWVPSRNSAYKIPEGVMLFKNGTFKSCINFKASFPRIEALDIAAKFANDLHGYTFRVKKWRV